MRASLDTNVIIHLYRAGLQGILFDFFDEVFIYEQIRHIELWHHGKDVLENVDKDVSSGRIKLYSDEWLKENGIYTVFRNNVRENRYLYGSGDLGEVYAISLAQTLGAYSLVTDDTKQGGPYMSLLQFEDDVMPFTFADVLILRYLIGKADAEQTVAEFDMVNRAACLNWSFRSHLAKFIRRFFRDPYRKEDTEWIKRLSGRYGIAIKSKMIALRDLLPNAK